MGYIVHPAIARTSLFPLRISQALLPLWLADVATLFSALVNVLFLDCN
ncbi:hypothetical protein [Nostoc sp. JL33]